MAKTGVKLRPSDYVHLHNHTQYSLLDGLTKVPALVNRVNELGMDAVAITDHGLLSGAIEFYKTANDKGLKPIVGMEAYVAPRGHKDKDPARDRQAFHLILLAMNNQGYGNLMRLSSIANLEGFYYRPRIDRKLLEKYNGGLIALSGCAQSELSDALRNDQTKQAEDIAKWYRKIFGDRYYLEVQDHGHELHASFWAEQAKINAGLLALSKKLAIPAVVTGDAHYLMPEDQEAHEVLLCVQTGSFLEDENRMSLKDFELHVTDPKQVIKRWGASHPELILNTKKIAARCQINIELGKILIPKFTAGKGKTEKSLLEELVWQGLAWRYGGKKRLESLKLTITGAKQTLSPEVIERAQFELGVVDKMGFNGYFLIVADFINWGKDQGIVFGPGRGSAASSIMAYALRITEIDPLKYELLFERFLHPDRISMPDMDIDIQDNRRDEVINYCIEKYGHDRVANIVTFGRMAARNSVRDVARVLRVPYSEADRWAKMIPPPVQGRHTPLKLHLQEVSELKEEYKNSQDAKKVFDLAMKLEGTIRSHGVHAAGVVIAPDDIVNFTPLEMAQKGVTATQYSMFPIEDLGLLKMDFLGLSNLTTIKNALRIIKKVYGKEIEISEIPLDDKKTYEMLQRGETTGVFQLESSGMKRYLKQLKPTVFEDIIAMVALYRPGPMQFIEDFIARKHGLRKIEYIHPKMEAALKNTYGVLVYQEQFMQISKDMSGFSGGQADTLRQAAGKKKRETMAKMKKEFIAGMITHSKTTKEVAEKIWAQIETFADYGFNKVHSACYGLIAYQTAYLKANYPAAFLAALMTSDYDNTDRLAIEITECKQAGIEVLPPDVSQSFHEFGLVPATGQIRFGLDAVKNVGHGAVEEILNARKRLGGKFSSLEDFCREVNVRIVNRKALESLIKAGALDSLGDRSLLVNNIDNILTFAARTQKNSASGQVDLFGGSNAEARNVAAKFALDETGPAHDLAEQLSWERELLGLYLSHHPLEAYRESLETAAAQISSLSQKLDGRNVTVGGSIIGLREVVTRNGAKMAFARIADFNGEIEVVVFPKLFQSTSELWQRDQAVLVEGKLNCRDRRTSAPIDDWKILAENVQPLSPSINKPGGGRQKPAASQPKPVREKLYIRLEDSGDRSLLTMLKERLDTHNGETEVVLVTGPSEQKQIIKLPQSIDINEESLRSLAALFGPTNVVVR